MPRETQSFWNFFRLKRVLAVNLVLFAVVGWGLSGEFARSRDMERELDRLNGQSSELQSKNFELARLVERFSSSEMAEREARLKLNLQKPGELVIIVRGSPSSPDALPAIVPLPSRDPAGPTVNVAKWWKYFLNNPDL